MAHTFDTGLARAQRTLIRDGVVSVLSGLLRANGGYLAAVIPWGGIVRGYTDEIGIDLIKGALNGRAPAIAVALGDGAGEAAGSAHNFTKTIELVVYFYANSPRSLTEGRTKADAPALADDSRDPGLDVMLEHAEELLIGQRLGGASSTNAVGEIRLSTPTVKQIRLVREEELVTDNTATLWAQRYSVKVERTINPLRGVTQLLEELYTIVRPSDADPDAQPDLIAPGDQVIDFETPIP